jgi:hypothetical protein
MIWRKPGSGRCCMSLLTMVDLPAPDGAVMTMIFFRRYDYMKFVRAFLLRFELLI